MYIELHAASAFSFLEGASLPEALVDRAAALGYPALALLDRDGVYGAPRVHLAAKKAGIRAIIGAELTIRSGGAPGAWTPRPPKLWRLPVLVATREGYRHLCRLVTRMKRGAPKGEGALTLEEIDGSTRGLVALVDRSALDPSHYGVGGLLDRVAGLFGRDHVYVELQRHLLRDQEADNQALLALASAFRVPVIATNSVRFATVEERPLHDALTCLRLKTTLARAGRRLSWNAERYLKPPEAMARLFSDLPEAVRATGELAERLQYTMADLGYRFPAYPVPAGETQASFLRKITEVGARDRYRPYHERARAQITRELDLIEKLDLAGYFLIVWDIVNFCRQHGILAQGRGSAANSAVCYSLGITAVDPVGMELLFERFLSEERGEWPDIDLDLPSGDRRERVIQYVYERYGALGAAMTANVITYRSRSAAREMGKVLDVEPAVIDRMARAMAPFEWQDPGDTLARHLAEVGLDASDPAVARFADLWRRVQDLPRHLGQHSGGMVLCQGRLDDIVPLEPATMPGRVVIQWDKEDCADMGIVKVDLLGLGMMAVLQDALTVINGQAYGLRPAAYGHRSGTWDPASAGFDANQGPAARGDAAEARSPEPEDTAPGTRHQAPGTDTYLDLAHLPPDDPAVYRMLRAADTIGVFQVESRAQMATLPRLRPRHFYDLVVEVALIRPGPIVGQMVHPYIARRNERAPVEYPHPSLEPVLKRTLGVPLFQEQLLRMAMVVAGFTGGEAEELRRAMGFKRSEARMRQIEAKLRDGMARGGITGEAAETIVRSITSFALYGFPESHAASFALLVYASAYLKAHYPAVFYAALLNNQPMGFYHPATLVKDAQRHGVGFRPIDVQASSWLCTVERDGAVRLGLCYVSGLREAVGRAMESQVSGFRCRGTEDGDGDRVRGIRLQPDSTGDRDQGSSTWDPASAGFDRGHGAANRGRCPKCGADDGSLIEMADEDKGGAARGFCNVCAHQWTVGTRSPSALPAARPAPGEPGSQAASDRAGARFRSLDHLVAATGAHRDELVVLAEIGALNAFGYDRRSALWQIERAVRPSGALFDEAQYESRDLPAPSPDDRAPNLDPGARNGSRTKNEEPGTATSYRAPGTSHQAPSTRHQAPGSPLRPMSLIERVVADYEGTGLTIGPHPMALRRPELALRGVLRSTDLPRGRAGRRVRVAGAVITRQRPGTAKGMVFLTLEDETGVSNVIVQPDVFEAQRQVIVHEPYVLVEGVLQRQDGVTAVRAERVSPLASHREAPAIESHDFR